MNLDIEAFALGASDYMWEKRGSVNILDSLMNENILPTFNNQKNWRYVQTPEGLRLSDGDKVYSFGLKDFGGELGRVPKLDDIPILDFESGRLGGGTAQIHRSSPDSIYLTLANGRENPTFRLEHESGKNWKYIPSKKMIKRLEQLRSHGKQEGPQGVSSPKVDVEAMLQGGIDQMKTAGVQSFLIGDGASSVLDPTRRGLAVDVGLYSNPFSGVPTALYDTGSHLRNGRYLNALGSLGMGALSFVPGVGGLVGKGIKAGLGAGAKLLSRGGRVGQAVANAATHAATSPAAQKAVAESEKLVQGGKDMLNRGQQAFSNKVHNVTGLQQHSRWNHGLQNPLSNGKGGIGVRSPLSQNFSLRGNLASGASRIAQKPVMAGAVGASTFHNFGVGDRNLLGKDPGPDKTPWKGQFMYKRSNYEGFFGTPSAAAAAINSGMDGVKNFLASALTMAGRHPVATSAAAVGAGFGLNRLRERMSDEHREEMEENPEKRVNREIAIPLLAGLGASALGNTIK